jgi:hypothetical protein
MTSYIIIRKLAFDIGLHVLYNTKKSSAVEPELVNSDPEWIGINDIKQPFYFVLYLTNPRAPTRSGTGETSC